MFKLFGRAKDAFDLHRRNRQPSTTDERKTDKGASRAERIKAICDLGKVHARSLGDSSLDPELLAHERENYERYKREAMARTRQVIDPVLRDRSIGHIIDLCMDGGEEDQARKLFDIVQADLVKRELARKYPKLGKGLLSLHRKAVRRGNVGRVN